VRSEAGRASTDLCKKAQTFQCLLASQNRAALAVHWTAMLYTLPIFPILIAELYAEFIEKPDNFHINVGDTNSFN